MAAHLTIALLGHISPFVTLFVRGLHPFYTSTLGRDISGPRSYYSVVTNGLSPSGLTLTPSCHELNPRFGSCRALSVSPILPHSHSLSRAIMWLLSSPFPRVYIRVV